MDALDQLVKTFFDWEAMAAVLPNMIMFGLPNTLILAVSSGVLGCILGMVLAVMGTSRMHCRCGGSPGSTRMSSAAFRPL